LIDVDEFDECEIWFIDRFIVWDLGVNPGNIILDCIIWVPTHILQY